MEARSLDFSVLSDALLEVSTQLLLLLASWVDWFFTEHLLLSNVVSAGLLLGLADFSIQTLELYVVHARTVYDGKRNYRSMQVGLVLGVFNHLWYAHLESFLPEPGLATVFKKIALDQAVAGPFFSSAFLVGMGLLEGKSTREVYAEWRQKFIHIYMVDWMFWPLAQFINFYLVPYRFRVFYVNFATFLWNTFLCYAKHHSDEILNRRVHHRRGSDSALNLHRSPSGDRRDRSRSRSSRDISRSPSPKSRTRSRSSPKAGSRSRKKSRVRSGLSKRRASVRSKLRLRQKLSPSARHRAVRTGPITEKTGTLASSIAVKKHLALRALGRDGGSHDSSWVTEEITNCATPSLHACSSSGSSITNISNTSSATTTRSTTGKISFIIPRNSANAAQFAKMPKVKKLGVFAKASEKNGATTPHRNMQTRAPLGMRKTAQAGRKPVQKPEETSVAAQNMAKKMWVGTAPSRAVGTVRALPARQTDSSNAQALSDIRDSVQELKGLVTEGQAELRESLEQTTLRVSQLQELCAIIYLSVEDGTRDLAGKADQLATWVTTEKKLDIEEIRTAMLDVVEGMRKQTGV